MLVWKGREDWEVTVYWRLEVRKGCTAKARPFIYGKSGRVDTCLQFSTACSVSNPLAPMLCCAVPLGHAAKSGYVIKMIKII